MNKSFTYQLLLFFSFSLPAAVIDEPGQRDLQLWTTYAQKPGLIAAIDRTTTKVGFQTLKEILAHPVSDINALHDRQAIIKQLLDDTILSQNIQSALKNFASTEQLSLANTDAVSQKIISNFYFKNSYIQWLNKYPVGLELGRVAHVANLAAPLLEHLVIHFLISDKLHHALGICCSHSHHHDHHHAAPSAAAQLAYTGYNIAHTAIHLLGIKGLYDHIKEHNDVIKTLQKELMTLRARIESSHEIYTLIANNKHLRALLPDFDTLESLFVRNQIPISADLQEFLTLIKSNTFTGQPSIFSRSGIILRTYALAAQVHAELQEKLDVIGVIDHYRACAQLYREYEQTDKPFTFATYKKEAMPSVSIQHFWNPLLATMQPIHQTLTLGQENPAIAIVTGANKAGKSTALMALATAIFLAQTLTIAPAAECALTPFDSIKTSFNMTARVNSQQSLFSASLDFAQEILAYTRSQDNKFALIIVDELFNSTDSAKGTQIAQEFAQALANQPNCIALFATHFAPLTELEQENPTLFKNYKAELDETSHEYHLTPGVSDTQDVLRHVTNTNWFD